MKHSKNAFSLLSLIGVIVLMVAAQAVVAQERESFSKDQIEKARAENKEAQNKGPEAVAVQPGAYGCTGPVTRIVDVGFEGLKITSANYFASPGGGEGGGFDRIPVLSTRVQLQQGTCLDAHLSAIVGSRQSYGVAPLTLFQVTLTRIPGPAVPRHMVGHYERPYGGANGPAVALEAERDVDMYASNFFQKVGAGPHEIPPGNYRVDVWWAGNGPGGAIGAAFVLKLYLR